MFFLGWLCGCLVTMALFGSIMFIEAPNPFTSWFHPKEAQDTADLAEELLFSIRHNPERWTQTGRFTFDRDDGVELWVANGPPFMNIRSPKEVQLPVSYKIKLWREYQKHVDVAARKRADDVRDHIKSQIEKKI